MTVQCCKCKKIQSGGRWKTNPETTERVTHTYCPYCLMEARRELLEIRVPVFNPPR